MMECERMTDGWVCYRVIEIAVEEKTHPCMHVCYLGYTPLHFFYMYSSG